MTNEELEIGLTKALSRYASICSEAIIYDSWSNEFARHHIKDAYEKLTDFVKKNIDFSNISYEILNIMGAFRWSMDENLYLLPIWCYPSIPEATKLVSINGEEISFSRDTHSADGRMGCLSYGVVIPTPIEVAKQRIKESA